MAAENRRQSRHVRWARLFFLMDVLLVALCFVAGIWIRFGEITPEKLVSYGPSVIVGAFVMAFVFYIGGLYAERHLKEEWMPPIRWLLLGFLALFLTILAFGSVDFSSRVGRGVLLISYPPLVFLVTLRHFLLVREVRSQKDIFVCLVMGAEEEAAARLLAKVWRGKAKLEGLVVAGDYEATSDLPVLGTIEAILDEDHPIEADVIFVKDRHLTDPEIAVVLRRARYAGIEILSLVDACEEAYQAVPLSLVTDAWLFRASNQSELFYIRKLKRLFDILMGATVFVVLSPMLLFGILSVALSSHGPIFFRQQRAGRLEKKITVLKLRTMHVEGAADGPRWASEEQSRIFPMGRFLRKFRIDEIPQLINVIKGDISFVGPRPEQIAFIDELDEEIPFYRERLLVQPGLTGWAQVRYPYGSSVEDAARKLEYDFYYMKHMSLFFDFFILLETVKVMVSGGVQRGGDREYLSFRKEIDSLREVESS